MPFSTSCAPTRRECEAEVLKALQEAAKGGGANAGKLTVREYLDRWLASTEPSLKPATHRRSRDLVNQHIAPLLGNIKLAKLSPLDIRRLHADRLATGLSPSSVYHLHHVFHRALEQAVRWNRIARNVTELVNAPRRAKPEAATWRPSQVAAYLAAGDETDLAAL